MTKNIVTVEFITEFSGNPESKKLWMVITPDGEDTIYEIWQADTDEELTSLIKDNFIGENEDGSHDESDSLLFDDYYDSLMINEFGTVSKFQK